MNKSLTLATLACAIAGGAQLTSTQKPDAAEGKQVQIDQPAQRLPENFEKLLKSSAEKVRLGQLAMADINQPTNASF